MRGWLFGFLLLSVAAAACETDHGALAKGSNGGRSTLGGATSSGGSGLGGFTQVPSSGGATGSGGRVPDESPGENVLTIVHGAVDAGPSVLCFAQGAGDDALVLGEPQPSGGLAYGESLVVRSVPGVDFANDALTTWIISGELASLKGLDCEQALAMARAATPTSTPKASTNSGAGGGGGAGGAGGAGNETGSAGEGGGPATELPTLRAARLPLIPAGTLSVGRSALLVAEGCIGGPAFDSRLGENACGAGYSATSPTLSAVLVQLSRRVYAGRLGLQVVNASQASGPVDVSAASPILGEGLLFIAPDVELGAVLPRVPDFSSPSSAYGTSTDWRVELYQDGSLMYAEPWKAMLQRAGLTSLPDGETFALVVLGPGLGLPLTRSSLWNPSRIVLVPTTPP